MPIENGKINWWALAALITPVVYSAIFWLVLEVRNTDKELLKNLIAQVSIAQEKHQSEFKEIYSEIKRSNDKQDIMIAELKDNYKTLCWAISMPYDLRKQRFDLSPFKFNGGKMEMK